MDQNQENIQTRDIPENGAENQKTEKKRHIDSKYWKIGLVSFIVIVCIILFYFVFFQNHTLLGFLDLVWRNVLPFIWGAVLAYLMKPVCNVFERWWHAAFKRMKNRHAAHQLERRISVACTVIVFLAMIYVLFAAVIPQVIESAKTLATNFPGYCETFFGWLEKVTESNNDLHANIINMHKEVTDMFADTSESSLVAKITGWVTNYVEKNYNNLINNITSSILSVIVFLKNVLVVIMSSIYILALRRKLGEQGILIVNSIFPDKASNKVLEEIRYVDKMFSGFINGKLLDSLIVGIICYIVLLIFRVPYPLLVSVVIGVTNIIPFFGPFIGAIPCAFIILIVDPWKCLTFVIIILVLQQLDGNVIGPKIIGENTGVSSFWVLFSIALFGGLWGFVGMIIGVPLFAVMYDLIRQLVKHGLAKKNKSFLFDSYREKQLQDFQEKQEKRDEKRRKRREALKKFKLRKKQKNNHNEED